MSVETEAGEMIEGAKREINSALKSISEVVVERVPGYDSWSKEYKDKLKGVMTKLLDLRDEL